MPRSHRRTAGTIQAPFLRSISPLPEKVAKGSFPFTLPMFHRDGPRLEFRKPVTLFVGENGTGKSTLLEAIARNARFNTRGGGRDHVDAAPEEDGGLAAALRFSWLPRVAGFFFRAESFFGFVSYLEGLYGDEPDALPWSRSLHHFSHGEAFLIFFEQRLRATQRYLYLLDEPEAALVPERQLEFLAMLAEHQSSGNVQYIIATHSPLMMACPGAELIQFTYRGLRRASYRETPHFQRYAAFFRDPDSFMESELQRIAQERQETTAEVDSQEPPSPASGRGFNGDEAEEV